jgi:hypothetical protein
MSFFTGDTATLAYGLLGTIENPWNCPPRFSNYALSSRHETLGSFSYLPYINESPESETPEQQGWKLTISQTT